MPKRSATDKINYYKEKIKKLSKKHRRIVMCSSSDSEENTENESQIFNDKQRSMSRSPSPPQTPPPSTSVPVDPAPSQDACTEQTPELEPELLQALGDAADDKPVYGPDIHTNLAQRWLPILKKGLQAEAKEKLMKEVAVPDNCKLLKAPTLNPEISAAIGDTPRARDKKLQTRQDQLGLGITAINRAMTILLTSDDKVQAIKILSDGCRLLTDLHYRETEVRTKLITPILDKSFLAIIQEQERDETLFGNTLPEKIKASKAIERQGSQIKKGQKNTKIKTAETSRPRYRGNWSGPPRYQSSSRGGRGGSYRTQYTHYRRTAARTPPTRTSSSTTTDTNKRAPTRQ